MKQDDAYTNLEYDDYIQLFKKQIETINKCNQKAKEYADAVFKYEKMLDGLDEKKRQLRRMIEKFIIVVLGSFLTGYILTEIIRLLF